MSPKLALPSVPLHCPGFSKSGDFIALDCPQFGNRIGDSCPGLPWFPHAIGDRIGDVDTAYPSAPETLASCHAGFSMVFGFSPVKSISPQSISSRDIESQGMRP